MLIRILLIAGLGWLAYSQFQKSSINNIVIGAISALLAFFLILGLFGHVVFVFSMTFLGVAFVVFLFYFFTKGRSTQKT